MKYQLRPGIWIGLVLPIIMIVFFVLLVFSTLRLQQIGKEMRLDAPHNMLWVTSQAQEAGLRLALALAQYSPHNAGQATRLERRHNVFISRIHLFSQGPQYRQLVGMGFTTRLNHIITTLPVFNQHFDELLAGNDTLLPSIRHWLQSANGVLGQMATTSMTSEWENLGGKLEKERNELWTIVISLIIILAAGTVLTLYLILTIFGFRRQAKLLSQEKAFSELLITSSEESIVAVDKNCCCTIWNPPSETIFKQEAGYVLGMPISKISPFFTKPAVKVSIDNALRGHPDLLKQIEFNARYFELRSFPLWHNQRVVGAILMAFDVTELREAEREIARHRDHLEEMVKERTKALDEALEREQLSAELSRNFGTMLSHQFRTPLAIVDSSLQRLIRRRDRLTPEEVQERGNRARHAIKRLIKLVTSTLDAARLDAGHMQARKQHTDLYKLVNNLCNQQQEAHPTETIRFECRLASSQFVWCDPIHVEHVLGNLISNAFKYSTAETPVDICLDATDQHLICRVSNKGDLQADSSAIFNRYYRGNNIAGLSGIGLGLYMAKMLAKLQGGDVTLDTSRDGIVSFILHLPYTADIEQ